MFSKTCKYAIKSAVYIASQSNQSKGVNINDVAKNIDSSTDVTEKILLQLVKNKIINSVNGPLGGFEIDKKRLKEIKLYEIVYTIDGDLMTRGCGLGLKKCSELNPCFLHEKIKTIRGKLKEVLEKTTVYELSLKTEEVLVFLEN